MQRCDRCLHASIAGKACSPGGARRSARGSRSPRTTVKPQWGGRWGREGRRTGARIKLSAHARCTKRIHLTHVRMRLCAPAGAPRLGGLVSRCGNPSCAQSAPALSRRVRARTGRSAVRTPAAASPLEYSGTFCDKAPHRSPEGAADAAPSEVASMRRFVGKSPNILYFEKYRTLALRDRGITNRGGDTGGFKPHPDDTRKQPFESARPVSLLGQALALQCAWSGSDCRGRAGSGL